VRVLDGAVARSLVALRWPTGDEVFLTSMGEHLGWRRTMWGGGVLTEATGHREEADTATAVAIDIGRRLWWATTAPGWTCNTGRVRAK
jgi:hypothetical protein